MLTRIIIDSINILETVKLEMHLLILIEGAKHGLIIVIDNTIYQIVIFIPYD